MIKVIQSCLVIAAILVGTAGPAAADPAGPTEYLTTIERIEPPAPAIDVQMIGGDSFFEVTQLQPVPIEVVGYEGEPYLRIRADGVVEENRLSATTYLNQERYGAGDIVPGFVDNGADPQWVEVGTGGRYAWHDHRSHWMNPQRPPGAEPGDTVLEAVVPLIVDGVEVRVTVSSALQPSPSPIPWIVSGLLGLVGVGVMIAIRSPLPAVGAGLMALLAGVAQVLSVPPETGPPMTLWLSPILALVAFVGAALAGWRSWNPLAEIGFAFVAGVQLVVWGYLGASALWQPILPTEISWPLHRAIVSLSIIVGGGAVAVAGLKLWALLTADVTGARPRTANGD